MRIHLDAVPRFLLVAGFALSCTGGGDGGDGGGFPGIWQYEPGSFSFVNCYVLSQHLDLAGTGFQIVDEAGTLVRISPDGCRFTLVQSTATHAEGIGGAECIVESTDPYGDPVTTHYTLKRDLMELEPDDASRMIEVFDLDADNTTTSGSYSCEISGNNTLDRVP